MASATHSKRNYSYSGWFVEKQIRHAVNVVYFIVSFSTILFPSFSVSLVVNIPNFFGQGPNFNFAVASGAFTPVITAGGQLQMTNGGTLEQTVATYLPAFEGGNSFRMDFTYGYLGPNVAADELLVRIGASGTWVLIRFLSRDDPSICIDEINKQYNCFVILPELDKSDTSLHTYTIEYHNTTQQIFVWVDQSLHPGAPPRAQLDNLSSYPPADNIAFVGGSYLAPLNNPLLINSFFFDSQTFVPGLVSGSPLIRPLGSGPISSYSTTNFTDPNVWFNNPAVTQNVATGSITHLTYVAGASWLLNPVSISSQLDVNIDFQFSLSGATTPGLGFAFVIQSQGVNIHGGFGTLFGFQTWPAFAIVFNINTVANGGTIYMSDGTFVVPQENNGLPLPYPSSSCSVLDLNPVQASLSIDLLHGWASVLVTNSSGFTCFANFSSVDPCKALNGINVTSHTAWVGFTSAEGSKAINTQFTKFNFSSISLLY